MKKLIYHLKNKTLIKTIKKKLYIKKNLHNHQKNNTEYLIGLGEILLSYKMNLNNPKTFNEWINFYKINYHNPLINYVIDKATAKEYVKSKGLETILVPTYGIFDSFDQIDFSKIPTDFVIKNTLDSGGVYVNLNNATIDLKKIRDKLKVINKEIINGKHWALENTYTGSINRLIIEKRINTINNAAPKDYKFFCFNGEPKFLFVASDRNTNCKFDFFDIEWNWIDVKQGHPNAQYHPEKPKQYQEMIEICKKLSSDFPFVRVDLYNEDGNIFFGELTFYHFAGLVPFEPKEYDEIFGKYFLDCPAIKKLLD